MTFEDYCKQNGCYELTDKERAKVLRAVQGHGYAYAERIAVADEGDSGIIALSDHNLNYYAGLEYCTEQSEIRTRRFEAWSFPINAAERKNGTQTVRLFDCINRAVNNKRMKF